MSDDIIGNIKYSFPRIITGNGINNKPEIVYENSVKVCINKKDGEYHFLEISLKTEEVNIMRLPIETTTVHFSSAVERRTLLIE